MTHTMKPRHRKVMKLRQKGELGLSERQWRRRKNRRRTARESRRRNRNA